MTDEYIQTSQEVKTNQHRNLLIVSSAAVIIGFGIYYFTGIGTSDETSKKKAEAASFSIPLSCVL